MELLDLDREILAIQFLSAAKDLKTLAFTEKKWAVFNALEWIIRDAEEWFGLESGSEGVKE